MLGVKVQGDLQWHAGVDPFTVETLTCGRNASLDPAGRQAYPPAADRNETAIDYDQGLNLLAVPFGAANSVTASGYGG